LEHLLQESKLTYNLLVLLKENGKFKGEAQSFSDRCKSEVHIREKE
jgi:hypothetical protein